MEFGNFENFANKLVKNWSKEEEAEELEGSVIRQKAIMKTSCNWLEKEEEKSVTSNCREGSGAVTFLPYFFLFVLSIIATNLFPISGSHSFLFALNS